MRRFTPDLARTARFWNQYLPVHLRYVYTLRRYSERRGYPWKDVEAAWERRHDWGAPRVCRLLQNMSGYYVKSAQIMASKGDFLPAQWTREMTPVFFDSMQPRPWHVVRKGLEDYLPGTELGSRYVEAGLGPRQLLSEAFAEVDRSSLASASIAQVHAGTLSARTLGALGADWAHGPRVVLKVQHRDMRGLMDSDIRNLRRLCNFVRDMLPYDPAPLLDEMRDTVGKEFDFVREARLMRAVAERLAGRSLRIRIPAPVDALTGPQMLVMQRLEGVPFSKILQGSDAGLRQRAASAIPDLIDCYGRMIFEDGLFHADPHAGNLLLQPDGGIGLLDFGQCKALPAGRHAALARLILALDGGSDIAVAVAMSGFGMDFRGLGGAVADPAVIRTVALIIFDTRPLREARIHPLAEDAVVKQIPLQRAPEDLFSLGRTIMLLRGLCFSFGLDIQEATRSSSGGSVYRWCLHESLVKDMRLGCECAGHEGTQLLQAARVWAPYAKAVLQNPRLADLAARNVALDTGEGL